MNRCGNSGIAASHWAMHSALTWPSGTLPKHGGSEKPTKGIARAMIPKAMMSAAHVLRLIVSQRWPMSLAKCDGRHFSVPA